MLYSRHILFISHKNYMKMDHFVTGGEADKNEELLKQGYWKNGSNFKIL